MIFSYLFIYNFVGCCSFVVVVVFCLVWSGCALAGRGSTAQELTQKDYSY